MSPDRYQFTSSGNNIDGLFGETFDDSLDCPAIGYARCSFQSYAVYRRSESNKFGLDALT